jgi:ABC-type glycerol-3-phosphate transport system substrate-binding protein
VRLRSLGAALAATALGISLAACGGSGDSGDSSGGGSGGDQTLTYWASNQGTSLDNDKQVLTPVLQKFTQETGIKVNLEVIGWNDLQTRIQTAITSGQAPDVVNIGNTWAASLQATDAFLPFDGDAMNAIGGKDKFVPTALATGGKEGTDPTSVPLYGLAYGLYYNKAMFAAAGLQPPKTWEEMVTDAKKLTNPAKNQWGMALAAGSYTENVHFAFINAAQNKADWFNGDGKPTFTGDGNVQGVLRYLDLMQKDKVANPSNAQYDNGTKSVNDFATKKVAMVINQNNADSSIVANGMKAGEGRWRAGGQPRGRDQPVDLQEHQAQGRGAEVREVHDGRDHPDHTGQAVLLAAGPEGRQAGVHHRRDRGRDLPGHLQHQVQAAAAGAGRGPVREHRRQGDERHVRQDRHRRDGVGRRREGGPQDRRGSGGGKQLTGNRGACVRRSVASDPHFFGRILPVS